MISVERAAISTPNAALAGAGDECVVFALGGETYAAAAALMRACLSLPRLTALDDTPDHLVGAFDLRGELVPVVSPAVLSGRPLRPAGSGDLVIVVDAAEHPLALHADAMLGIEPMHERSWVRVAPGIDRPAAAGEVILSGGRAWFIDPGAIRMIADAAASSLNAADARLSAFEAQLDDSAIARLEARAERYRGLVRSGRCASRLGRASGNGNGPGRP
jgi:chemotaxis signal transduction protein